MKITIFNVLYKFIYVGDFQINRIMQQFFSVVSFFGVFKTLIIYGEYIYNSVLFICKMNSLKKKLKNMIKAVCVLL